MSLATEPLPAISKSNPIPAQPVRPRVKTRARACRHCGIPTASETEAFCCSGCAYVFQLVQDAGLGAYYQIKDKVTAPADSALLPSRDYHWLASAQREAELAAGTATPGLALDVQGISCAGCVWLIERVFQKQAGAGRIEVSAGSGQLRLTWEPGEFSAPDFARTLQGFNYLVSPASLSRSAPPESRGLVRRIGLCAAFAMNVMLFTLPSYFGMEASFAYAGLFGTLSLAFATLSLLAGGGYFYGKAFRCLREGTVNIDLPIALGITGAYGGSFYGWLVHAESFVYFDFVSTFILLMLVGRWAQLAAVERNQRRLLAEQPAPPRMRTWTSDGELRELPPERLVRGMKFAVPAGQTIPVEARLTDPEASVSLAWINGESAPRLFHQGQRVPSGAVNLTRGEIVLEATEEWKDSLLAQLTRPATRGAYRDRVIERIITGYLIGIITIAVTAGLFWYFSTENALRSCSVVTAILVVSCPCAIGLAFPLADEIAAVALRKRGVFVRVADLWPRLARIRKVVFDKTGTLTLETPALTNPAILSFLNDAERSALFALVQDNPHPIARCLHERLLPLPALRPASGVVSEVVGQGVALISDGVEWRLGRSEWASQRSALAEGECAVSDEEAGDAVLSRDGAAVAHFSFREAVRHDAAEELRFLQKNRGLRVYVLSGDRRHKVERMTAELGLAPDAGGWEMSPQDKSAWLEAHGAKDALMLGDGANDSLAFDRALCRGTPVIHRGVLSEKADFYYLGHGIAGIRALLEVNDARRRTQAMLLVFSVAYNLLAVGLAVAGRMNPLLAAILMPVSSLVTLGIVGLGMKSVWRKE